MSAINKLKEIRKLSGLARTSGISDQLIEKFIINDPRLQNAIEQAAIEKVKIISEFPEYKNLSEVELLEQLGANILNFYSADATEPYVPLAAKGPWIVTFYGAVMYDVGGYGMIGFGHNPDGLDDVLKRDQVMANVMTRSFNQHRIINKLKSKIGYTRQKCPYANFLFMNSGSEAMAVATRISDLNCKTEIKNDSRTPKYLGFKKSFHGRTYQPAQASDSSLAAYQNLASFKGQNKLITIDPNNVEQLENAFKNAKIDNYFIEAVFFEPVMGEGNPGMSVTPEYYAAARRLCTENNAMLISDSIQAGIRGCGALSIVDYPGFQDFEAPDMESFSKAISAGQYPLSVLALSEKAKNTYKVGVYGNTMTANPRGLDVACFVLDLLTEDLRENIVEQGIIFKQALQQLANEFPNIITIVQGTGLLLSCEINPKYPVTVKAGLEEKIRLAGLNVIHGGDNALRFTPVFDISEIEINLAISIIRSVICTLD